MVQLVIQRFFLDFVDSCRYFFYISFLAKVKVFGGHYTMKESKNVFFPIGDS